MEKLETYLETKNLKRKDFCAKVGISESALCRILKGVRPTLDTAIAIHRATRGRVAVLDWEKK